MERSAGIVLVRTTTEGAQALIVHPGGPYFARKHEGAWNLPKGEVEAGETDEVAARREFHEETGQPCLVPLVDLGEVRMKSGKRVHAFGARGEFDVTQLKSNEVDLEYPAKSGRMVRFPELDQAQWVTLAEAKRLLNPALVPLVEKALELLG